MLLIHEFFADLYNLALNDLSNHENIFLINISKWNGINNNKLNSNTNQVKWS
jgi:hypothetical protein